MSTIDDIQKSLESLSKQFEGIISHISGYSAATKTSTKATDDNEKAIEDLTDTYGKYQKTLKDVTTKYKDLLNQSKSVKIDIGQLNKVFEAEIEILKDLTRQEQQEAQIRKAVEDIIKKETATLKDHIQALKAQKDVISNALGVALSYGKVFGAQDLGMQNLRDKVLKYNQSMFDLTRIQKSAGSGTSGLNKALQDAERTTSMNQIQTLGFANSMSKLYLGVKPTTGAFVKLASAIQREFGPSMETTEEVARDLMDIQNKWPSLYDNILSAHDKMVKGIDSGNKSMTDSAQSVASSNLLQLVAMGASRSQIEKVIRLQNAQATGQDEIANLNRDMAKSSQSAEDAVLAVGKAAEGAMDVAAKATKKFYDGMKLIPSATASIVAGMGLIDLAANSNLLNLSRLIAAQTQLNSLRTQGNMIGSGTGGGGGKLLSPTPNFSPNKVGFGEKFVDKIKSGASAINNPATAIGGFAAQVAGFKLINDSLGALNAVNDESIRIATEQKIMEGNLLQKILTGVLDSGTTIVTAVGAAKSMFKAQDEEKKSKENIDYSVASMMKQVHQDPELMKKWEASGGDKLTAEEQSKINRIRIDTSSSAAKGTGMGGGGPSSRGLNKSETQDMKTELMHQRLLKIYKELKGERNKDQDIKKTTLLAEQQSLETIQKSVLEYMRVQSESDAILKLQKDIASSMSQQLDIAKSLGTVNDALLISGYKAAEEVAQQTKKQLDNIYLLKDAAKDAIKNIGLSAEEKQKVEVQLQFEKGMSPDAIISRIKEAEKIISGSKGYKAEIDIKKQAVAKARVSGDEDARVKAEKELNALLENKNGLTSISAIVADKELKAIQARANAEKTLVAMEYEKVAQHEKYNSLIEANINMDRQLAEAGQLGMGASVTMMQKQVDLAYERIAQMKKGDDLARERLMTERGITPAMFDQIHAARSKEEIDSVALRVKKEQNLNDEQTTILQYDLNAYAEKHLELIVKSKQQTAKVYELTKEVREGYLSAIKQMAVGSSGFSKIIGNQTRGTTQLMSLIKRITGSYEANTYAAGGMVPKGTDLGQTPGVASTVTGGTHMTRSVEDQALIDANKRLYISKGFGKAGTAQAPDLSAIKERGVTTEGGGPISAKSVASTGQQDPLAKIQEQGTSRPMPVADVNLPSGSGASMGAAIASLSSASMQPVEAIKLGNIYDILATINDALKPLKETLSVKATIVQ